MFLFACQGYQHFPSYYEPSVTLSFSMKNLDDLVALEGSTPEVTRIYLIRHGQSQFHIQNEEGQVYTSGKSKEIPLSEDGVQQAHLLGTKLASLIRSLDVAIYTSTARRSQQTGQEILSELPRGGAMLGGSFEDLCEVGMGMWEGKPKDATYQSELQKWKMLSAKEKYVTPKVESGESFQQAADRGLYALSQIAEEGRTAFVIMHENILNALVMRWMNATFSEELESPLPGLSFDYGDMLMIEVPRGQPIEKAQLKMWIKTPLETQKF